MTICIPHTQRSWIGKAHFAGKNLCASFIYTDPEAQDNSFWGPYPLPQRPMVTSSSPKNLARPTLLPAIPNHDIPSDAIEWCLLDGTPASCTDIGLHHLIPDKFDLVISGPNVGRNTSAAYITSSGTVGAAMEAVITGNTPAIGLSWAYFDGRKLMDDAVFYQASKRSCEVIQYLKDHWHPEVDLYSINIPLLKSLCDDTKVMYAPILENKWCNIFSPATLHGEAQGDIEDGAELQCVKFHWNPDFRKQRQAIFDSEGINDGRVIENGMISVTPLRAVLKGVDSLVGEIKLDSASDDRIALTIDESEYIHKPLFQAFVKYLPQVGIVNSLPDLSTFQGKILQFGDYEHMDMDQLSRNDRYFTNSYIYRKALIRKHYLSHTIHSYIVKHPESILNKAYMESFNIDVDYAEFLDDALDENWELRQELESEQKWWILKPSMSDKGQGIRVFKSIEDLQTIFDSFDEDPTDDEDNEVTGADDSKIVTSQLRHFIVQEYLNNPLLLDSADNKKFHIRCYITCKGDLQVYVFDRMLALFAPTKFVSPDEDYSPTDMEQLECHLTNTCLQTKDETRENSVKEFDSLTDLSIEDKNSIKKQIHDIAREIFLAAVNVNRLNFQPISNAFEIYGFDFLVDSSLNVKILEVNAFPDFKQTGADLKDLIDELFDNVVKECVVPIFQKDTQVQSKNFVKVLDQSSNDW